MGFLSRIKKVLGFLDEVEVNQVELPPVNRPEGNECEQVREYSPFLCEYDFLEGDDFKILFPETYQVKVIKSEFTEAQGIIVFNPNHEEDYKQSDMYLTLDIMNRPGENLVEYFTNLSSQSPEFDTNHMVQGSIFTLPTLEFSFENKSARSIYTGVIFANLSQAIVIQVVFNSYFSNQQEVALKLIHSYEPTEYAARGLLEEELEDFHEIESLKEDDFGIEEESEDFKRQELYDNLRKYSDDEIHQLIQILINELSSTIQNLEANNPIQGMLNIVAQFNEFKDQLMMIKEARQTFEYDEIIETLTDILQEVNDAMIHNELGDLAQAVQRFTDVISYFMPSEDVSEGPYEMGELTELNINEYTLAIPKHFVVLKDTTDGFSKKEFIAYDPNGMEEGDDYGLSNVHIMLGRTCDGQLSEIPVELHTLYLTTLTEQTGQGEIVREIDLGERKALLVHTSTGMGDIFFGLILVDDTMFTIRMTFNQSFTNAQELAQMIVESFEIDLTHKPYVDFISLESIDLSDFELGGRIERSIRYYLTQHFNPNLEKEEQSDAFNNLFIDLINVINFSEYQEALESKLNFSLAVQKAIVLYHIRSFMTSFKTEFDRVSWIESYVKVFNDMFKAMFSSLELDKAMLKQALGFLGEHLSLNDLPSVSHEDLYAKKMMMIQEAVQNLIHQTHVIPIFNKGKLNALQFIDYLNKDVIFFTDEQIGFNGEQHIMQGLEVNSARIWAYPEVLLDVNRFFSEVYAFIEKLEENKNLCLPLSQVNEEIYEYFNEEDITGFTLLNLFAQSSTHFMILEDCHYLIHLDDDIKEGLPHYQTLFTELIKSCRTYNGLSNEFLDLTFEDRFDLPSEILQQYGLEENTAFSCRYLHPTYAEEDEEEDALVELLEFIGMNEEADELSIEFEVAGTGQDNRALLAESLSVGDCVNLVREVDNEYDEYAIAVKNHKNELLGYVAANIAAYLSPALDEELIEFNQCTITALTPLSKRSKRARNALINVVIDFIIK